MKCECCKSPINTGGQFTMHAGRPWKVQHLIDYKAKRRTLRGK